MKKPDSSKPTFKKISETMRKIKHCLIQYTIKKLL